MEEYKTEDARPRDNELFEPPLSRRTGDFFIHCDNRGLHGRAYLRWLAQLPYQRMCSRRATRRNSSRSHSDSASASS